MDGRVVNGNKVGAKKLTTEGALGSTDGGLMDIGEKGAMKAGACGIGDAERMGRR
jgi:hypothetical protein